jgi:imidazolonepropionase-like amidohydrolase
VLAIRAERVFDGERMRSEGALVLIEDGRIVGVEDRSTDPPAGWPVRQFPKAMLLPGLIDTHVHLCGDGRDGALDRLPGYAGEQLTAVIEAAAAAQLAAGVTTVRDLGDRRGAVLDWRRTEGQRHGRPHPTVVAAGPPVTCRSGHCWNMGGEAEGADQLRRAVRERADLGADVVKIMASGGAMTPGTDVLACQFTLEEMRAAVDEAHRVGLPVTAHAHALPAVRQALAAGVDGIEHCTCLTPAGIALTDDLLDELAAAGTVVCPTLGEARREGHPRPPTPLELAGATVPARLEAVGRMYRAGVRLVSGADTGIADLKPHGLVAEAVIDLGSAGVPALAALASATSVAADACGVGSGKGRIRPGYDADLLIVEGDPAADLAALRRVAQVVVAGQLC